MQVELHLDLDAEFVGPQALRAEVRAVDDSHQREITITVRRPGQDAPIADLVLGLQHDTGELRVLLSADGDGSEHRLCVFPLRAAAKAVCPI